MAILVLFQLTSAPRWSTRRSLRWAGTGLWTSPQACGRTTAILPLHSRSSLAPSRTLLLRVDGTSNIWGFVRNTNLSLQSQLLHFNQTPGGHMHIQVWALLLFLRFRHLHTKPAASSGPSTPAQQACGASLPAGWHGEAILFIFRGICGMPGHQGWAAGLCWDRRVLPDPQTPLHDADC